MLVDIVVEVAHALTDAQHLYVFNDDVPVVALDAVHVGVLVGLQAAFGLHARKRLNSLRGVYGCVGVFPSSA